MISGYVPVGVFGSVCTRSVDVKVGRPLGIVNEYVAAGGRLVVVKFTN
jgi:hypothetical protein